MFKKDSTLYKVNIIAKIIALLIFIIMMIKLSHGLGVFLISGFFVYATYSFYYHGKIAIVLFILTTFAYFYPQFMWIIKLLYIIEYFLLSIKLLTIEEVRYFVEHSFYKYQNRILTYYFLNCIYFFKYLKENILYLYSLKESYGFSLSLDYCLFIYKKSIEKTKTQIDETIKLYQIRFYNNTKKRSYLEKLEWERWDSFYILIHLFIFAIAFWIGG